MNGGGSTMKMQAALLLAVTLVVFPFAGIAAEKKVTDLKELAGSWQGWVTGEQGQERATMIVQANGNYKASTVRGSTSEGQFYLQDGKLLYRSSRTTGKAQLAEDKGKTTLSVIPDDPNYRTGRGDYERVK
jgi:hypothetical protein